MNTPPIPVDISHNKDLLKLAEKVKTSRIPRVLTRGDEKIAAVMPASKENVAEKKHNEDAFATMLSAVGSWNDLDTNTMIKNIYKARKDGSRSANRP